MAFHDKGFWIGKGGGHLTDAEALFNNSSRVESKRPHQWYTDASESELFPHKRQAIESPNNKSICGISSSHLSWDNLSTFQSSPNQFIDRLLGSPVDTNKKIVDGLSMSYTIDSTKVKVNQVKNTDSSMNATNFITMGANYGDEDGNVTLMGHSFSGKDEHPISSCHSFDKEDAINFGGFQDEHGIDHLTRPINGYYVKAMNNYGLSFDQSTVQTLESSNIKELDASNAIVVEKSLGVKQKTKSESKPAKKEAPNSFPSNVRSLMATGILDGVPVKYVSLSREELQGIIKGSGYLCGCQSCNHSKALNAYEFERHAGCKTKHPNNHIYFESGKTIYQIVQELRSTQESLLFDAIQTVTGSPINQKAFRSWKESFQAATRELRRIYGREELNL